MLHPAFNKVWGEFLNGLLKAHGTFPYCAELVKEVEHLKEELDENPATPEFMERFRNGVELLPKLTIDKNPKTLREWEYMKALNLYEIYVNSQEDEREAMLRNLTNLGQMVGMFDMAERIPGAGPLLHKVVQDQKAKGRVDASEMLQQMVNPDMIKQLSQSMRNGADVKQMVQAAGAVFGKRTEDFLPTGTGESAFDEIDKETEKMAEMTEEELRENDEKNAELVANAMESLQPMMQNLIGQTDPSKISADQIYNLMGEGSMNAITEKLREHLGNIAPQGDETEEEETGAGEIDPDQLD